MNAPARFLHSEKLESRVRGLLGGQSHLTTDDIVRNLSDLPASGYDPNFDVALFFAGLIDYAQGSNSESVAKSIARLPEYIGAPKLHALVGVNQHATSSERVFDSLALLYKAGDEYLLIHQSGMNKSILAESISVEISKREAGTRKRHSVSSVADYVVSDFMRWNGHDQPVPGNHTTYLKLQ